MYYLVITNGDECQNQKIILKGTYADICKQTSQYEDSYEIRYAYNDQISEFLKQNQDKKNSIVIVEPYKKDNEIRYKKYKVLYQKDIEQFNKLLNMPDIDDKYFHKIVTFWKSLVDEHIFVSSMNTSDMDFEFIKYANRFKKSLAKIPGILKSEWYSNTDDDYFGKEVFSKFKEKININDHPDNYYEIARTVVEAFELWKKKCRKMGSNPEEIFGEYVYHKITKTERYQEEQKSFIVPMEHNYQDNDAYDEFQTSEYKFQDDIHSKEYLAIKTAIEKKDVPMINQFIQLYGVDGFSDNELEEIRELIKINNIRKKR